VLRSNAITTRVSQRLGDERAASTAQRVAVFRPLPPGPVWDLPADWSFWERRHPLQRARGTTLLDEMPAFSTPVRAILGRVYTAAYGADRPILFGLVVAAKAGFMVAAVPDSRPTRRVLFRLRVR